MTTPTAEQEETARAIVAECGPEMAAFLARGRKDELIEAIAKVLAQRADLEVPDLEIELE